jgi:hypothetical protein
MNTIVSATTTSADFTPCLPVMEGIHGGEFTLMDLLLSIWERTDKESPMGFRKEWVAFAEANGYCKQWAGQIARDAGFRVRDFRSDIGKSKDKPTTNKKPNKSGVTPEQLAHMAKGLDKKGLKTLIQLLIAID